MRDFEGSGTIATSPDRLFNYLRDVRHLSEYFPKALSAKTGDGEDLVVVVDIDGQATELRAWFRADARARMLQWGVPEVGYQGWMAVTASPQGSGLIVHVQKPAGDDAFYTEYDLMGDGTEAEIRDSITSIQRIMDRVDFPA